MLASVSNETIWNKPGIQFFLFGHLITQDKHVILETNLYQTCLLPIAYSLTHRGRVSHICVNKLTIIGPDNGLSPGRRKAIIWTNAGILLIRPLGTNCNEIVIEFYTLSLTKMYLKMSSGKWRPFCLGFNVLRHPSIVALLLAGEPERIHLFIIFILGIY